MVFMAKMPSFTYYSPEEDALLEQHYQRYVAGSARRCQSILRQNGHTRTIDSIQRRYEYLRRGSTHYRDDFWSDAEVMELKKHAGLMRVYEMRRKLPLMRRRSVSAIQKKADILGISLQLDDDSYSVVDIATMIGVSNDWVAKHVLPKVRWNGNRPDGKPRCYRIKASQIKYVLRKYPSLLDDAISHGARPDMYLLVELLAGILPGEIGAEAEK